MRTPIKKSIVLFALLVTMAHHAYGLKIKSINNSPASLQRAETALNNAIAQNNVKRAGAIIQRLEDIGLSEKAHEYKQYVQNILDQQETEHYAQVDEMPYVPRSKSQKTRVTTPPTHNYTPNDYAEITPPVQDYRPHDPSQDQIIYPRDQSLKLSQALQEYRQRISDLEERLRRSNQTLSISQNNANTLQYQLRQSQESCAMLRGKHRKSAEHIDQLNTQVTSAVQNQQQCTEELLAERTRAAQIGPLHTQLTELQRQLNESYQHNEQCAIQIESIQHELAATQQELIEESFDKKNLGTLQQELTNLMQERNDLCEQLTDTHNQCTELQGNAEKLEKLGNLLAQSECKIAELYRDQRREGEHVRKEHNNEMQELYAKLALVEDRMQETVECAQARESEIIDAARIKFKEMKGHTCALEEQLAQTDDKYTYGMASLEEQINVACEQLAAKECELENQKVCGSNVQQQYESTLQECCELQEKVAQTEQTCQDTEQRIELLRNDALDKEETLTIKCAHVASLEKELGNLQDARENYNTIQKALSETTDLLAAAQRECEQTCIEKDSLAYQCTQVEGKWRTTEAELACITQERGEHAEAASHLVNQLRETEQECQEKLQLAQAREIQIIAQGKESIAKITEMAQTKFAHFKETNEQLRDQLTQECEKYAQTQGCLDEVQEKCTLTQQCYDQDVEQWTKKVCGLETERDYLESGNAELAQQMRDREDHWNNELASTIAQWQDQVQETEGTWQSKLAMAQEREQQLVAAGKESIKKVSSIAEQKFNTFKQQQEDLRTELAGVRQQVKNELRDRLKKQLEAMDIKLSQFKDTPQGDMLFA